MDWYIVAAERPNSATGRAYISYIHDGVPVSSPFADDAMFFPIAVDGALAAAVCAEANALFGGYQIERAAH